jgi:hypothetical protein
MSGRTGSGNCPLIFYLHFNIYNLISKSSMTSRPIFFNCILLSAFLCFDTATMAQTNSFPLYSKGDYGGGSGDATNTANPQLKLESITGYVRVAHISVNGGISTVYNYQTGKDVYWGEDNDIGSYRFRGRSVLITSGKLIVPTGNVGIGTSAPGTLLEVRTPGSLGTAAGSTAEIARFSTTTGNYSQLKILFNRYAPENGNGWMTASTRIQAYTDNSAQAYIDFNPSNCTYGMAFGANSADVMRILPDGNVLIGKTAETNAGYKLDVNGNLRANKVVVNTTGADYVFEPTYRLRPLAEVDKYIRQNHHLPDVAPAGEMKEKGLDVGDNQTVLLKKIEELTLYAIAQQQQIETQKNEVRDLRAAIETLKALIKK